MKDYIAEIDPLLKKRLGEKGTARIIVEFFEKPEKEQIERIRDIGVKVERIFKITPLVSGSANREQIEKMSRLRYVKKVWLDSEVRALGNS